MKTELRKEFKKQRDCLENKALYSEMITRLLLESDFYKSAETVLLYNSTGSEVSTDEIFRACLRDGKKTAFPVCLDKNGKMEFFVIEKESDLQEGMYGIYAPEEHCPVLSDNDKCLCCVPGLSFDKKGFRLGYGKGYYDRYLSNFKGISVGLCYDALVSESLPADKYDKSVNYLITDKKIYKFNSKEDFENG